MTSDSGTIALVIFFGLFLLIMIIDVGIGLAVEKERFKKIEKHQEYDGKKLTKLSRKPIPKKKKGDQPTSEEEQVVQSK